MFSINMNKDGVFLQDIYLLSYCGLKVIFEVCKTYDHSVCLIELATKNYKDGISLTKYVRPTFYPLVITKHNRFSKSTFEVFTRPDKKLVIPIDTNTRLYWEALKYVPNPPVGRFLAVPFPDYLKTYWKKPKKLKKGIDKSYLIN